MDNEQLKQKVFEALGFASMCWNPMPSTQVFDSNKCSEKGEELVAWILDNCLQKQEELTDEEIEKFAIENIRGLYYDGVMQANAVPLAFIIGAKWMRDKSKQ